MVDSVFRTRSLGVAAEGLPDQYADGKAAKVWEYYIGCHQKRSEPYRNWILDLLQKRDCHNVLDVACGTGIDSILLLEEGFQVTSTDASDKMLKYALRKRWDRRREDAFDKWVIEEANWLTLEEDMNEVKDKPEGGYDAVICLGNSFAHLPDFEGHQLNQKEALVNFHAMVKPGGILVIDHRNYDDIISKGVVPSHNIYYNSDHITDLKCSNLFVNGKPTIVTLDYTMDMSRLVHSTKENNFGPENSTHHFRLSYYPHLIDAFSRLLRDVFGQEARQEVYGDFQTLGEIPNPAYYIHVIEKTCANDKC